MLYPVTATFRITLSPDPGSSEGGDHVVANGCDAPALADSNLPCAEVDDQGIELVTPGGYDDDVACPGNLATRAQCTELFADDGTTLIGRRSSTTLGQVTTLEVVLRRDGGTVYAAAANTLDDKWGRTSPASAEAPPLTLDQLEDLVRNDTWVRPAS